MPVEILSQTVAVTAIAAAKSVALATDIVDTAASAGQFNTFNKALEPSRVSIDGGHPRATPWMIGFSDEASIAATARQADSRL